MSRGLTAVRARPLAASLVAVAALLSAGCGAIAHIDVANPANDPGVGKTLFKDKCGTCHTLADAGTTGAVGPNLDDAFRATKDASFHTNDEALSVIVDVVRGQIAYSESDPGTGQPGMPPGLLNGQQAKDVAVYVAKCAANPSCNVTAKPVGNTPG